MMPLICQVISETLCESENIRKLTTLRDTSSPANSGVVILQSEAIEIQCAQLPSGLLILADMKTTDAPGT